MPSSGLTEKDQFALKKFKEAVTKALGNEMKEIPEYATKELERAKESLVAAKILLAEEK